MNRGLLKKKQVITVHGCLHAGSGPLTQTVVCPQHTLATSQHSWVCPTHWKTWNTGVESCNSSPVPPDCAGVCVCARPNRPPNTCPHSSWECVCLCVCVYWRLWPSALTDTTSNFHLLIKKSLGHVDRCFFLAILNAQLYIRAVVIFIFIIY